MNSWNQYIQKKTAEIKRKKKEPSPKSRPTPGQAARLGGSLASSKADVPGRGGDGHGLVTVVVIDVGDRERSTEQPLMVSSGSQASKDQFSSSSIASSFRSG
jgi:hypothetical protein